MQAQRQRIARTQSLVLVFCCTILGAAAQTLMKIGVDNLQRPGPLGYLLSVPVMCGLALYGVNTILLIFALKDGELSILYPVIALTYVWVTLVSMAIFNETLNVFKTLGVASIVAGVGILGAGGRR